MLIMLLLSTSCRSHLHSRSHSRTDMAEFTLSATARYDFNWNGEDDYIVRLRASRAPPRPGVARRARPRPANTLTTPLSRSHAQVTQMDNHASVYVRAYQASETQKSTISGGYEVAFLFWTGEVVVFGQDCDWATIRYNVSDILTYQQEYKIGVDLVDESMKIYIDGHHTISYNMSATNCLAGSIGFKTFLPSLPLQEARLHHVADLPVVEDAPPFSPRRRSRRGSRPLRSSS